MDDPSTLPKLRHFWRKDGSGNGVDLLTYPGGSLKDGRFVARFDYLPLQIGQHVTAPTESDCLWRFLEPLPSNPSIQCRWHWRAGDVVVWDERAIQHFGVAYYRGQDRVLRRVMVTGATPR